MLGGMEPGLVPSTANGERKLVHSLLLSDGPTLSDGIFRIFKGIGSTWRSCENADSDLGWGLGWGLRLCVFNEPPDAAVAAGPCAILGAAGTWSTRVVTAFFPRVTQGVQNPWD